MLCELLTMLFNGPSFIVLWKPLDFCLFHILLIQNIMPKRYLYEGCMTDYGDQIRISHLAFLTDFVIVLDICRGTSLLKIPKRLYISKLDDLIQSRLF